MKHSRSTPLRLQVSLASTKAYGWTERLPIYTCASLLEYKERLAALTTPAVKKRARTPKSPGIAPAQGELLPPAQGDLFA